MIFTSFILVASTLHDDFAKDTYTKYSNQTFDNLDSYQLVNVGITFIYQGDCTPLNNDYVYSYYTNAYVLDYEIYEITYHNQVLETVNITGIKPIMLNEKDGANRIREVYVLNELQIITYTSEESNNYAEKSNRIRAVTINNLC